MFDPPPILPFVESARFRPNCPDHVYYRTYVRITTMGKQGKSQSGTQKKDLMLE